MQATSMKTSLFHGHSNTVGRKIFHSVCPVTSDLTQPFKSKGKWLCSDKSQERFSHCWVIWGKHHSDNEESAGGRHYNAGEADSHVSKNPSKTSFKEEKYLQQNTVQRPLQAMEAGRVKRVEKLRIT